MPSSSDASDTIRITGLTATGHHGVFDFEKRDGQPFRVDAELTLDFRAAGRSDELRDTVSYVEIAELIESAITGEPFDLIEALADHLAREILRGDDRLLAAEITVHKPEAPLAQSFHEVSVTARRTRADLDSFSAAETAAAVKASGAAAGAKAEVRAVLSLGSNLGDSAATLASAVTSLQRRPGLRVLQASPLARTRPVGGPQDQPDFLNQVIEIATNNSPQELLALTQQVEAEHHRARGAQNGEIRWGPRTLDIDIITYASAHLTTPSLQIPHPRAAQRGFVLVPWMWMDPQATLDGVSVTELAAQAADSATVEPAEEHTSTVVRP